jgi:hypothetical protein
MVLYIEISCSQWEGSACTQSALIFSLVSFEWQGCGGGFLSNMFPMCSSRIFPIAAQFNFICFAQSSSLLTYMGGPKATPSFHRIFYFGEPPFSLEKKEVRLVRHPN